MKRVIPILLLSSMLITGCASSDKYAEADEIRAERHPNVTNTFVSTEDGTTYEIKDGRFFLDGSPIHYYGLEPSLDKDNTLSVIDETAYCLTDEGLIRIRTEERDVQEMFYDLMDKAIVGLTSIYYTVGRDLYCSSGINSTDLVDSEVTDQLWLASGNYLFYKAKDDIKKIDLIADNIETVATIQERILEARVEEDTLYITTELGEESYPIETEKEKKRK